MDKCINDKDMCHCNKMRECNQCNGNNIKSGKCVINSEDFCTCRLCGKAVRADGYRYNYEK